MWPFTEQMRWEETSRGGQWNSAALTHSRQKATLTELVTREMELNWEVFFFYHSQLLEP